MNKLLQTLHEIIPSGLGSVLFVAAGKGEFLPALRKLGAEQIVLCESNPVNLQFLGKAANGSTETLLPIAATTHETECVDLHVMNNARYSSTAAPARIIDLRPNLKKEHTVSVPAKSLARIIEELVFSDEKQNLLIFNAQGCNHSLLCSLPTHQLYEFEWLLVNGMQIPEAYAGDSPISETIRYLKDLGFELIMNDPEVIHPNATVLFRRLPLVLQVISLESKLNLLAASLEDANLLARQRQALLEQLQQSSTLFEQQAKERQTRIEALTRSSDENAQLANERASQIESLNQAKAGAEKLAAERQTQLQQVSQDRDAQTQQLAESQAQLAKLQQARTELEQQSKERQTRIEALTRSRDEQTQLANERASQIESLNQAKAGAEKLAAERQTQLQQVSQDRDAKGLQLAESQSQHTHIQQKIAELEQQLKERQAKIESLIHTRDEQSKKISQQTQRITQLETEQSEMDARQNLLNEEMIRAEAQIDLIKDVLLREPGLRE